MRDSFEIIASSGSYPVTSGVGLLAEAIAAQPQALIVIDVRLAAHLPAVASKPIVVEATESSKSLERMPELVLRLRELGANRSSHILAIGGGVIQDIVTFCASIYMRGIPWTYLPTTLLGMADSCIGGKSSINVHDYKNLIGNFFPPERVLIDLDFVRTLDAEQIVGGLFEAGKICYARGPDEFREFRSELPALPISEGAAQRVVMRALRAKKWFIEVDEFDQKERLLLNFGHTFGHALEAGTAFGVSHGVAVGIGMLVATKYAAKRSWLTPLGQACARQLDEFVIGLMGRCGAGFFADRNPVDVNEVLGKFDNDKKHRGNSYRMIVPEGDGALELVSETRNAMVRKDVSDAFQSVLGEIGWRFVSPLNSATVG